MATKSTGPSSAAMLAEFHKFYARLAALKGSNYTMIRNDGVVLVRYPGPITPGVRLDADSGFMQSIA